MTTSSSSVYFSKSSYNKIPTSLFSKNSPSLNSTDEKIKKIKAHIELLLKQKEQSGSGKSGRAKKGRLTESLASHKKHLSELEKERLKDKAAISIQKVFRSFSSQKSFLPRSFYPKYKTLCEDPNKDSWPTAKTGKTKVYLPSDCPEIILKKTGRKKAIQRFQQMQTVRAVLRAMKCTQLVIPRVRLCGEFLIEERLSISTDPEYNKKLYKSDVRSFDKAVRDMVHLFSEIYISCLLDEDEFYTIKRLRYDNLPFLKGKIGLIDLERITDGSNQSNTQKLYKIAAFFPYHINLILKEANKLRMDFNKDTVKQGAYQGRTYLEKSTSIQTKQKLKFQYPTLFEQLILVIFAILFFNLFFKIEGSLQPLESPHSPRPPRLT